MSTPIVAQPSFAKRTAERALQVVLTLWLTATVTFLAVTAIPGDPVDIRLGPLARVSEQRREDIRQSLGLDEPVWLQYVQYLWGLVRGDFGVSYQLNQPVIDVLSQQLGHTLQLTATATVFLLLFVTAGQMVKRGGASWHRPGIREWLVDAAHVVSVSVPTYWIGYTLLIVFAFTLGWLPSSAGQGIPSLVLPGIALATPLAGLLGRVLDAELDAAERTPFAASSRARGMGRGRFALCHGLRHAVPAVAAMLTTLVGGMLGGAVLVESVFARSGLGRVVLTAVVNRDLPVVMGLVIVSAAVFAVLGLLAESVVWWADPRPASRSAQ